MRGGLVRGTRDATLTFAVSEPVARVEIDPERLFPDARPDDNVWTGR